MITIGIDFGTTNSAAAYLDGARPIAVRFADSQKSTQPSVVFYGPDQMLVGEQAWIQFIDALTYSEEEFQETEQCTVRSIKRRLSPNGRHVLPHQETGISHEQIVADILAKLKNETELFCLQGQSANRLVLTHPVDFLEPKKELLRRAAEKVGFTHCELIEEPVAAAIGYSSSVTNPGKGILVYDFGGGTFDTAFVVRRDDGSFTIVESAGSSECGGDDIDQMLFDYFDNLAGGLSANPRIVDPHILYQCRRAKEKLSGANVPRVEVRLLEIVEGKPQTVKHEILRDTFEQMIRPIVDKTISLTVEVRQKAEKNGYKVDALVLIGGSSQIPLVKNLLQQRLPGISIECTHLLDTAVALGAAVFGQPRLETGDPLIVDLRHVLQSNADLKVSNRAVETLRQSDLREITIPLDILKELNHIIR